MATNPSDQKATNARVTSVRPFDRPNRRRKFYVEWRSDDGRFAESFMTAALRDSRVHDLRRQMLDGEMPVAPLRREIEEFRQFKAAVGDTPWLDVVAAWKNQAKPRFLGSDASTAVTCYLMAEQDRVESGQLAKGTFSQKKCKLNRFASSFGGQQIGALTTGDIQSWLDQLSLKSPITFNDHLKHARSLFDFYKKSLDGYNPANDIPFKQVVQDEVGILTVEQTKKLFDYAQRELPGIVPRLAMEAFAGLRFSSSQRLEYTDLNFKDQGILLPAKKLKTKRRYYVDGLPGNVWDWLEEDHTIESWSLTPAQYMHLKSRAFIGANIPHPHNCLRHSFASYHVAAFKNPGLTATLLCHTNQAKLWSNYNGVATRADGVAYFKIKP